MASKMKSRHGAAANKGMRTASSGGTARARRSPDRGRTSKGNKRPSSRKAPARPGARGGGNHWLLPMVCASLVIFAAWSFYPVARVQYGEQRQKARLEAELQSLKERNNNLRREVDNLKTPEGVEQVARESLGLVKEGENVYVVLDGDETATVPVLDPDTASAALPRESGWLTFLDALFGFK